MPAALIVSITAWLACASAHAASSVPVPFPVVDGSVQSLLVDGDTAYVGGHFRSIGTLTGPLVFLDRRNGRVRRGFPSIAGRALDEARQGWAGVRAVEPDGAGGLYVGGHFGRVAGKRRSAVVHLRADGSVDPRFRTDVEGRVHALARAGGRLWIGGSFLSVAGRERHGLAVVDARTGALTPLAAPGFSGEVNAIEHAHGRVYVGGVNTFFDGEMRDVGAFDAATGALLPWRLGRSIGYPGAIEARGDKLYVAGGSAYEIGASDGRILREFPFPGPESDIALAGDTLVVGGRRYDHEKPGLYAFDLRTGAPRAWSGPKADFTALTGHGGTVYASHVTEPGGTPRAALLALDARSGRVRWRQRQPSLLYDLLVHRGRLVVAGLLRSFRPVERHNLAAIDLSTGRVKKFDPRIEGFGSNPFLYPFVRALAKRGRTLYVGGAFSEARGARRQNLVAVDAVTGRLRGDLPDVGGSVLSLARSKDTLYVGGEYFGLGDQRHAHLGAVDLRTRRATAWAPEPSCEVEALTLARGVLFAGGCFGRIAGLTDAPGLAAFDARSGALSPRFRPQRAGGTVHALAPDGRGGVWVGGDLGGLENGGERGLERRDADGRLAGGVPLVDGSVHAVAARGGQLFVGGVLASAGGRARQGLAAARTRGGAVTAFDPRTSTPGPVVALAALPRGGLLAGGFFGGTEFRATSGLARFRR